MEITTAGIEDRSNAKKGIKMSGARSGLRRGDGYGEILVFPEGDENA